MIDTDLFSRYVNDDIRETCTDEIKTLLRSPEHIARFRETLIKMKLDCDTQLSLDKAHRTENRANMTDLDWEEYIVSRQKWRAGTIRFKNGIEKRIVEINTLTNELIAGLTNAIRDHRDSVCAASDDDDTSNYDDRLWRHI